MCLIITLFVVSSGFAQIEQGDKEIQFNATYLTANGLDFGIIQGSYGLYVTSKIQIGVAPILQIVSSGGSGTDTQFSAKFFFNYNFSNSAKTIPYINFEWYQFDFSPEEGRSFTDLSFVNIGGGIRNFISENIAVNTGVFYGFPLAEGGSGILQVLSGFSVIF